MLPIHYLVTILPLVHLASCLRPPARSSHPLAVQPPDYSLQQRGAREREAEQRIRFRSRSCQHLITAVESREDTGDPQGGAPEKLEARDESVRRWRLVDIYPGDYLHMQLDRDDRVQGQV